MKRNKATVYYYNHRSFSEKFSKGNQILAYDMLKAATALQGIVNRKKPVLFIDNSANRLSLEIAGKETKTTDKFWFDELKTRGGFLDSAEIKKIPDFFSLFEIFGECVKGAVIWDEKVPSTANAASTVAGALDMIPVRGSSEKDALMPILLSRFKYFNPIIDLRDCFTGDGMIYDTNIESTGSAKCDAYIWALEKFLKTGICSHKYFAHYTDGLKWNEAPYKIGNKEMKQFDSPYPDLENAGLPNSDFYISKKAFFFDLAPWRDEKASDDPSQPAGADAATLHKIFQEANKLTKGKEILTIGGFTPWWLKYCDIDWDGKKIPRGRRGGVATEWESVDLFSAYNAILDADAFGLIGYGNASFYTHIPIEKKLPAEKKSEMKLRDKIYIMFMMGDYDSAAWLSQMIPVQWHDKKRGSIPLSWSINPVLSERAPQAFNHIIKTKTENDFFGAQEGAGYMNLNMLSKPRFHSNLPDASRTYSSFCKKWYKKIGMNHTIFTIFTNSGNIRNEAAETFSEFSRGGVGIQQGRTLNKNVRGVPFIACRNDFSFNGNTNDFTDIISKHISRPVDRAFYFFRTVLVFPSQIKTVADALKKKFPKERFEIVGANDFFRLLKIHYDKIEIKKEEMLASYNKKSLKTLLKKDLKESGSLVFKCGKKSVCDYFIPVGKWREKRSRADIDAEAVIIKDAQYLRLKFSIDKAQNPLADLKGSAMLLMDMPCYEWAVKWLFIPQKNSVKFFAGENLCTFHPVNETRFIASQISSSLKQTSMDIIIPWERAFDPFIEYPELKAEDIVKSNIRFSLVLNDKAFPDWKKEMFFGYGPRPEEMKEINLFK